VSVALSFVPSQTPRLGRIDVEIILRIRSCFIAFRRFQSSKPSLMKLWNSQSRDKSGTKPSTLPINGGTAAVIWLRLDS
jgi:hypothetical protein